MRPGPEPGQADLVAERDPPFPRGALPAELVDGALGERRVGPEPGQRPVQEDLVALGRGASWRGSTAPRTGTSQSEPRAGIASSEP